MIQCSPATKYNGKSHINPNNPTGFKLFTDEGLLFYRTKVRRITEARKNHAMEFYRVHMRNELKELEDELTEFLDDEVSEIRYNMSSRDTEGWHIYHTLLDQHTVLKYFIRTAR